MRLQNDIVILNWPLMKHILTQGMYSSSGAWHGAIDMRCTWNGTTIQEVYAAEDGVVDWVQDWNGSTAGNQSYGNAVRIKHADYNGQSLATRYAHLSSYTVKKGQQVKEGQLIGYTGTTGKSSGVHLHFEVILAGSRRNPLVWLDGDFSTAWDTVYTYGPGEGPVNREEDNTMNYTSDTLKIGPVSTGDRKAVTEYAAQLGAPAKDDGDYLIVGPMSAAARDKVAEKAKELALGCADYFTPSTDNKEVLEKLDLVLRELYQIQTGQDALAETVTGIVQGMSEAAQAFCS